MYKYIARTICECLLCCIDKNAWIGRMNIIPTIIIGNMEMELPAIHIINKFIGNCFRGPSAMSQDFYKKRLKNHREQRCRCLHTVNQRSMPSFCQNFVKYRPFSKLFHCHTLHKICNKVVIKYSASPQKVLKCIATITL